jgi:hypothetical protein
MDLVLTRRFAQATLLAVLGLPLQAFAADSVPGSPDSIDRQVLIVLDPRTKPPRAIDLARQDHTRDGVTAFIADNDGIDGIGSPSKAKREWACHAALQAGAQSP